MNTPTLHSPGDPLEEAVASYYRLLDQRLPFDRVTFLARYPELATDLAAFLDTVRAVEGIAHSTPVPDATPRDRPAPPFGPLPAALGEYELLEELGRGGMGVVYKARQPSLNRTVALKLILAGEFASRVDVDRFHREAEAVACLDHPRIVPIYEIGNRQGRHFFSMKFLDGGTLSSRKDFYPGRPRDAAEIVREIALAVHHAHQHGILHRDLKPGNIILDSEGNPHVTDFGLARPLVGDSGVTPSGAAVGTPSYMAPEQAAGANARVSTAADVYSLGAILYELLTGAPPFRGDTPYRTVQLVLHTEPVPPRRLNPGVPRDLETICLKALAKVPDRRYRSAAEFADDLNRWLNNEPIQARPVGTVERAYRWCRRNPVPAALSAALVVSVLVGMTLVGVLWRRAEHEAASARVERDIAGQERDAANRERDIAAHQRQRAEGHLARAQDAIGFIGREVSSVMLADVPHADQFRRAMIEYAIRFHAGFLVDAGDEPGVRQDAALAYLRTGKFRARLGETVAAIDAFQKAIALFEALHRASPGDPTVEKGLSDSLYQLVVVLADTGKADEARQTFARCEELLQSGATTLTPSERQQARAALHAEQLQHLRTAERFAEAETVGQEAIAIYEKLLRDAPDDRYLLGRIARLQGLRGWNLKDAKRNTEAKAAYEQGIALFTSLLREAPLDPGLRSESATARRNYAIFLRGTGDHAAARAEYRVAQGLLARLVDDFPEVVYYRSEWAESYFGEALLDLIKGEFPKARPLLDRAVALQREAVAGASDRVDLRRRFVRVLATAAQAAIDDPTTDHAGAVKLLTELRRHAESGRDFSLAGQLLVACIQLALLDERLTPTAKTKAAENYTAEFVALVQRARDLKHKEWVALLDNPGVREIPPHPKLTRLLEARKAITPP